MKTDVVIIGIHQSYVGANAGGYIRLKEFLKNVPKNISYKIVDLSPSIYSDVVSNNNIVTFNLPKIVLFLLNKVHIFGILFERIYSGIHAYNITKKIIQKENAKVIYVPIGEFIHLYIPAVLLKKEFPHIKIVIDILNFHVYKKGFIHTFNSSRKKSSNYIVSFATDLVSYLSFYMVKKTIKKVDYIFTVSLRLVETIKEIYNKETIDFTPSGVSSSFPNAKKDKKYLGVYVGRLTEQKGIYNLLNVWEKVVKLNHRAKLAIAGIVSEAMLSDVKSRIHELGLEKDIIIFGEVSESDKFKIISESKIFLHLANYEPLFPVIGILEGLSGGLPVIVFDMPVVRSEVKKIMKNNYIIVVDNNNIKKASDFVLKLDRLTESEKDVIAKGAKAYAKKFDWSEIAKIEFKIITSFINEK